MKEKLYTPAQVSKLFGVSDKTVVRWCDLHGLPFFTIRGKLAFSEHRSRFSRRMIKLSVLHEWMKKHSFVMWSLSDEQNVFVTQFIENFTEGATNEH